MQNQGMEKYLPHLIRVHSVFHHYISHPLRRRLKHHILGRVYTLTASWLPSENVFDEFGKMNRTEPNHILRFSQKKKCVYKEMIMFIGNFMLPYFIELFLNDYHLSWCPTFFTYNYISSFENEKPEGKSKQPSYTNTYFNSNDRMTGLQRPSLNDLSVIFGVFSSLTFIILWLITPFMILVVAESGYVQSYYPVNFTSKGTL